MQQAFSQYTPTPRWLSCLKKGSLNNDGDDSSENVTRKMNLGSFKCYQVYLGMLGIFPGLEFLRA